MRKRWFSIILGLCVIVMAMQATRLLRAEPPTVPRAGDVANAKRVTSSRGDEREAAPPPSVASANGVVEPLHPEVRVGVPVSGQIARVAVAEGQRVAIGDVLVELDRRVEEAQLAAAEAEVVAARAELDRAVRGTRAEEVRAARAETEGAKARAALARGIADRTEMLARSGAVTGDELERSRKEADAAGAAAKVAEAREQAAIAGSRREDIQLARARLDGAEARRDQARVLFARMQITAPVAGEVLQLPYRVGEFYQAGGAQGRDALPVAVIGDTSRLRVRLDVDERDIGRVAIGARAVVRASAYPGNDYTGTIVEVARRMGRKNLRTDDPVERNDTKIREAVISLDGQPPFVVGQRVTAYVLAP